VPVPASDVSGLFPAYPATAEQIEGCAGLIGGTAGRFQGVENSVTTLSQQAAATVTGTLVDPVAQVPQPVIVKTQQLSEAAVFAGAAVRRWAGYVETFNAGVSSLNSRWRAGVASEPSTQSALRAQLTTEHLALEGTLDAGAVEVAGLLDAGPTAESLTALFRSGDLPATDYLDGTLSDPTGMDAVIAELIARGTLPPEVAGMTPEEFDAYLLEHPEVATALTANVPGYAVPGSPEALLAALLVPYMSSPETAAANEEQRQADIRALFGSLSEADAAMLAMLFPTTVGALPGAPFDARITANRVNVIAALAAEEIRLSERQAQDAENEANNGWLGWKSWDDNDMDGAIDDSEGRIALYESILADNRQILLFDPSGDGTIAELHGTIGPETRNVGVLVPGTGTDMSNVDGFMSRSRSFEAEAADGSLAMITWMGTDLPDSVYQDAPFANYADAGGPPLSAFSHQLGDEIDATTAAAQDVQVTVAGHSYGGAVVGTAEQYGLEADRVLHIESAGMGHDVDDPSDLNPANPDVRRYSMTAPGDPIDDVQGISVGDNLGLGADPDTFPGTTRLNTGFYEDGTWVHGSDAHGGVFTYGSDSWRNMYEVFTGGTVDLYVPPETYVDPYSGTVTESPPDTPPEEMDIP